MKLVVHNDDFGLNYGFSEAILDCFKNGITTSTSVRTDGTAYKNTKQKLFNQKIGIGLHVNLTDGKNYKNFIYYFATSWFWGDETRKKMEEEIEKQFIQVITIDHLKIKHVNGHDHVHMIPPIFYIVAKLCKKYHIKYLRLTQENYYLTGNLATDIKPFLNMNILRFLLLNILAKINKPILKKFSLKTVAFYGLLHTNEMNLESWTGAIQNAISNNVKVFEVLSHPAYKLKKDKVFTSNFIKEYTKSETRTIEANTLKNDELKNYIKSNKITLTNFSNI